MTKDQVVEAVLEEIDTRIELNDQLGGPAVVTAALKNVRAGIVARMEEGQ